MGRTHHQHTGRRGERHAARWLRKRGLRILGRNLKTPIGEIDLLAQEGAWLVVVEVKTGDRARPDALEARIDRAQRHRLQSAVRWVARHARTDAGVGLSAHVAGVRCDWVLVRLGDGPPAVTHLRDVFGGGDA